MAILDPSLSGRKNDFLKLATDLTGTGSGGGTEEMGATNYAVTPGIFTFGPPADEVWQVAELIFYISDTGVFSPDEYANLGAPLTNGFSIVLADSAGAAVRELAGGYLFKTNGDFARIMGNDVVNLGAGGGGNDSYSGRWSFVRAGLPLRLVGSNGDKIGITLTDDLSGVTSQTFYADAIREIAEV